MHLRKLKPPKEFREANWVYAWLNAWLNGYFWLPCPICGREFGGHESDATIPDPSRQPGGGLMICPFCEAEGKGNPS